MIAMIVGVVLFVLGVLGLIFWFSEFITVLIGSLPFIFVVCGLAAIAVGISSAKDKLCAAAKVEEKEEKKEEKAEEKKEGE